MNPLWKQSRVQRVLINLDVNDREAFDLLTEVAVRSIPGIGAGTWLLIKALQIASKEFHKNGSRPFPGRPSKIRVQMKLPNAIASRPTLDFIRFTSDDQLEVMTRDKVHTVGLNVVHGFLIPVTHMDEFVNSLRGRRKGKD